MAPGTAVQVADLSQPSTSGANNPEKPQPKKRAFVVSESSDGSEDDLQEDTCEICKQWNPPVKASGKVDWEGCEQCDKWYHCICMGGAPVEEVCDCH